MTGNEVLSIFDEMIRNSPLKTNSATLAETIGMNTFMPILNAAVIAMRSDLRKKLLNTKTDEEVIKVYDEFYKEIQAFYAEYYDVYKIMYDFINVEEEPLRISEFLKWYSSNKPFLAYRNGVVHRNEYKELDFELRVGMFKSHWSVYLLEVTEPLHKTLDMVEIKSSTKISEEDWDGEKEKIGIEIIRRNCECSGIVINFAFIEDLPEEEGKMFYFYSSSSDGNKLRYYKQKLLK